MDGYLNDILLALSVIAAPIIFGLLLYYGLTINDRHHHEDGGTAKQSVPNTGNTQPGADTAKAKSA
ncbi:MAG: hypothetical protein JSR78_17915 [Proteobacteria bacterium]|nr:hypothetical protein [Pseudomonadota bacterium]